MRNTRLKLRNKFEKRIYSQLSRAKVSFKYESEKIPYLLARHYIPDFIIQTKTGKIYIECKGYLRPEHKAKLIAVKKLNGNGLHQNGNHNGHKILKTNKAVLA